MTETPGTNAPTTAAEIADYYIAAARAMPDGDWHISRNADGGAAAEDFIRRYAARNADAILARRASSS